LKRSKAQGSSQHPLVQDHWHAVFGEISCCSSVVVDGRPFDGQGIDKPPDEGVETGDVWRVGFDRVESNVGEDGAVLTT
jgi:hypothetical protein